ncbi:hypothetical protein H696_02866 [Fonticula alba]|uniref:Septin-type G domain-containing protein n=1 Tax=Fonticula alba TaxID=691883 RepID=A0A058ZAR2_FONAL|nr:hypothetical protein H696_02866 [Fonticula alba]KCV70517.1 hypothetical protein H696_02866 [Fonticula alba]|eukprot:XP_009495033.1 hypothetical protein H696_02866 [Fonticula alba]
MSYSHHTPRDLPSFQRHHRASPPPPSLTLSLSVMSVPAHLEPDLQTFDSATESIASSTFEMTENVPVAVHSSGDPNAAAESAAAAAAAPGTEAEVTDRVHMTQLNGFVGFHKLCDQVHRRAIKHGFEFNVMVVGPSGIGKSTFINTLFSSLLLQSKSDRIPSAADEKTVVIERITHQLVEQGTRLLLTVIDTPGFGDHINNQDAWEPIVTYIKKQYDDYRTIEARPDRPRHISDTRVHLVIYFLQPGTAGLRPLDAKAMYEIGRVANLIPVIAKSDSLTMNERAAFKAAVKADIQANKIAVYPNSSDLQYDEEETQVNVEAAEMIPFAIIGATDTIVKDSEVTRGRITPFGIIDIENEEHCEFSQFRRFIIHSNMKDLIDVTSQMHYEHYRARKISKKKRNRAREAAAASNAMTPS